MQQDCTIGPRLCQGGGFLQLQNRLDRCGCCGLLPSSQTRTFDPVEIRVTANCCITREEFSLRPSFARYLRAPLQLSCLLLFVCSSDITGSSERNFCNLRWGCREHFVSRCWHSPGRDYGRYPRECRLSALGVLHPGVPVMWQTHIRDLSPHSWKLLGGLLNPR